MCSTDVHHRFASLKGATARVCSKCQGCQQWVNYFLHSGHLAIDGLKMSKSLKNFITIREALTEFSARQIRLLFCLQAWHRPMTFNNASREEMVTKEATLKNFFQNVEVRSIHVQFKFDSRSIQGRFKFDSRSIQGMESYALVT